MFRLLVIILLVFWGVWVFKSCENTNPPVEETGKEDIWSEIEDQDEDSEGEESGDGSQESEEDTSDEEDDSEEVSEEEISEEEDEDGDSEDKEDDNAEEAKETTKSPEAKTPVSTTTKKVGRYPEVPSTTTKTTTKTTTTTKATTPTWTNTVEASEPQAPMVAKKETPDRDTYIRVYIYDNRIDTFGKAFAVTGRVHFEVINATKLPKHLSIPGCKDLGVVKPGIQTFKGIEMAEPGEFDLVASHPRLGEVKEHFVVVE